jgi:hypothetical protein
VSEEVVEARLTVAEVATGLVLAVFLLFFIRVIEDDDLAIARRPEDVAVEVAKKFLGELSITRSVTDEVFPI